MTLPIFPAFVSMDGANFAQCSAYREHESNLPIPIRMHRGEYNSREIGGILFLGGGFPLPNDGVIVEGLTAAAVISDAAKRLSDMGFIRQTEAAHIQCRPNQTL